MATISEHIEYNVFITAEELNKLNNGETIEFKVNGDDIVLGRP